VEGFRELQQLGVKTVISVDGARPDLETARQFGLRYVHLPHGYDGIPASRVRELAKAVRDLEGPIYIHCHHGKHRSPAAGAVACVAAGLLQPENALSILTLAGTSENYRGLYQSAESARALEASLLDALEVDFRETVPLPPLAEAMVAIEQTHGQLKVISDAAWKSPAKHPDLEPAHEALLLREHFTELLRSDEVSNQPQPFVGLLRDSEDAAQELETSLTRWKSQGYSGPIPDELPTAFSRVTQNCTSCHQEFRDVPLSEKSASGNSNVGP
jgi:hypothetical protein